MTTSSRLLAAITSVLALMMVFCSASKESPLHDTTSSSSSSSGHGGVGGETSVAGFNAGGGHVGGGTPLGPELSFIWIANTGEGTLSKVYTITGVEVARYITSPQGALGDPSRTSVNMHGDVVVTNRHPDSGPSSVTKFAADASDCDDRNGNNQIETSNGPTDVKPWGEDECMLWNTPLTGGDIGARATAWDGLEDPETGKGGHVFIGAMVNRTIYKLDGDTGQILDQAVTALGHYGGAIDNKGNFWTVDMQCTVGICSIERISVDDLNNHNTVTVPCGYGISVDAKGRIWTGGMTMAGGCINRYDPTTDTHATVETGAMGDFNRGIAVGTELSEGYAWAANTGGDLIQVDLETVTITDRRPVGGSEMVGVAVDFEGYVWTVSKGANSAYKVHPGTWNVDTVTIGLEPYTYSDMTGMQLRGVIEPPK